MQKRSPRASRQEERLERPAVRARAHASSFCSTKALRLPSVAKGRGADFIVGNADAEMFFQRRDHIDHRHRVELRNRAQQRRRGIHRLRPRTELERAADHHPDIVNNHHYA